MFLNGIRPLTGGGAAGDASSGMEFLNPFMPYYVFHNMDADDADAIVAYLRVVPGVENTIAKRTARFDVQAAAPPLDVSKIPAPLPSYPNQASAQRGKYLASQLGLCVECHTKHNEPGMATILDESKLFAGGEDFSGFFAATLMLKPVSKNLTSDDETGLGKWTTADIVKALKEGKAKDNSGICPPMPAGAMAAYGHLTDADAMDIANYIKSLPPKVNKIVDMCAFPPPQGAPPPQGGLPPQGAPPPLGADGGASNGGGDAGADATPPTAAGGAGFSLVAGPAELLDGRRGTSRGGHRRLWRGRARRSVGCRRRCRPGTPAGAPSLCPARVPVSVRDGPVQ
jgi:cytochrome c553